MTESRHDDHNAYLWDRSAPPDTDAVELEEALGSLRFTPTAQQADVFRKTIARRRPLATGLLLAASLLLTAGVGAHFWRLSWPTGQAWTVTQGAASSLAVGSTLETRASEEATVSIARIGTMNVLPGSSLSLTATTSSKHRIDLSRGVLEVRTWAPPGRFVVRTPAGDVVDLGCVFQLEVDGGRTILRVQSGWVRLDNAHGESLIPAGANSIMTADRRALVAVYEDASPAFGEAVRQLETADSATDRSAAVATMMKEARTRDVYTLLTLAVRSSANDRAALVARAAELSPPPAGVSAARAGAGDDDALWKWADSMPLPAPKAWWRNWKDVFPR